MDSAQKAGRSFSGRQQIFLHKKKQMGGEVISLCNQILCVLPIKWKHYHPSEGFFV